MKKIYFDDMKNKVWIAILLFALVLILIGGFKVFEFKDPKVNNWISAAGFMLHILYFSRIFWHRNVVQWNKKGVYLRVNSYAGKSLKFNQIKNTELANNKLIVTKINNKKLIFNLNNIEDADTQKLNEIFITNTEYTKL